MNLMNTRLIRVPHYGSHNSISPTNSGFREGKRKYSLARVVARLKKTSEFMIAMQFLVDLEDKLRALFLQIWLWLLLQRFKTVSC